MILTIFRRGVSLRDLISVADYSLATAWPGNRELLRASGHGLSAGASTTIAKASSDSTAVLAHFAADALPIRIEEGLHHRPGAESARPSAGQTAVGNTRRRSCCATALRGADRPEVARQIRRRGAPRFVVSQAPRHAGHATGEPGSLGESASLRVTSRASTGINGLAAPTADGVNSDGADGSHQTRRPCRGGTATSWRFSSMQSPPLSGSLWRSASDFVLSVPYGSGRSAPSMW